MLQRRACIVIRVCMCACMCKTYMYVNFYVAHTTPCHFTCMSLSHGKLLLCLSQQLSIVHDHVFFINMDTRQSINYICLLLATCS